MTHTVSYSSGKSCCSAPAPGTSSAVSGLCWPPSSTRPRGEGQAEWAVRGRSRGRGQGCQEPAVRARQELEEAATQPPHATSPVWVCSSLLRICYTDTKTFLGNLT